MTTYRYIERDQSTGAIIYAETGATLGEIADKVGFDRDDAANLWEGATPGKPLIDEEMPGKDGIIYLREFHIDA